MSHRLPPAPKLRTASRGVHPRGPEPCHPEVPRGVRPAYRLPQPPPRRALTLIEMLVALAVTLVMMAAVVNLFANISGSIRNRRAVIEVSGQLRQVRQRLALDLAGATCKARTWQRPSRDPGYIEIIEGQWSDANPSILLDGTNDTGANPPNPELDLTTSLVPGSQMIDPTTGEVTDGAALGDWDDILALTAQSEAEPFKAQVGGNIVESTLAEVFWFAGENPVNAQNPDIPGMRRIYRRVFLIAPWLGPWDFDPAPDDKGRPQNVSVRFVPGNSPNTGQWVANTLGDLTKRENRAYRAYDPTVPSTSLFPHILSTLTAEPEFLVLDDALAFDVRVFDPGAPLYEAVGGTVVQPGDPGWFSATAGNPPPVGYGAYVDLGWNWDIAAKAPLKIGAWLPTGAPTPLFEIPRRAGCNPNVIAAAAMSLTGFPAVYDTWSFHYENDGIAQDFLLQQNFSSETPPPQFADWQLNTLDQGTNGLDDEEPTGVNGVDDPGERETAPPYDFPLRGVKVSLRIYERDARQIREVSVTHSFAP